jgi:predicted membrane-bound spermidine synthase
MKIDQKNIGIGFIAAFIILMLAYFGYFIPYFGIYLAPLIGGMLTGYLVNNTIKSGMMHGTVVGTFIGIASIALLYLRFAGNPKLAGTLLIFGLWYIGTFILLGLVGGALGSIIKQRIK